MHYRTNAIREFVDLAATSERIGVRFIISRQGQCHPLKMQMISDNISHKSQLIRTKPRCDHMGTGTAPSRLYLYTQHSPPLAYSGWLSFFNAWWSNTWRSCCSQGLEQHVSFTLNRSFLVDCTVFPLQKRSLMIFNGVTFGSCRGSVIHVQSISFSACKPSWLLIEAPQLNLGFFTKTGPVRWSPHRNGPSGWCSQPFSQQENHLSNRGWKCSL